MTKRARFTILGAAASVLAGLAVAAGVYAITSGTGDHGPEEKGPCDGLPSPQCQAFIATSQKDFEAKLAEWLAQFNSPGASLRSLRRVPSNADYPPPYETFDQAAQAAGAIVVGAVEKVAFDTQPPWWASVTLSVEQTLKGTPAGEITLRQGGGPWPYLDWDSAVLVSAEADPPLLPGDRAILFLQDSAPDGVYEAQPWTGQYLVSSDGRVSAPEANPFASSVGGLSLDAFAALVHAAVSQR